MEFRTLGRTDWKISTVSFGAWAIGGTFGTVKDDESLAALHRALDRGVNFFDTADVYGDGRSERMIAAFRKANPATDVFVATKMGRRAEQVPSNYVLGNFRQWLERSRRNLDVERIDLVQLHCPPTEVYRDDAVFDALDVLVGEGVIANYGVSVETVEQALIAIGRPGVATVQIILNAFRHKPLEQVLPAAIEAGVGVLARVPLASGLLSGRYRNDTTFAADDHRNYNRHGEAFDVGETFAGVDYETGVVAAQEFARLAPDNPAGLALRWIIDQPGVTSVIPGARNVEQARANAAAAGLPPVSDDTDAAIRRIYDERIRPLVHDRW
jgi:aryl-alcohol dehydrogenase-like predicted oxidoreductase